MAGARNNKLTVKELARPGYYREKHDPALAALRREAREAKAAAKEAKRKLLEAKLAREAYRKEHPQINYQRALGRLIAKDQSKDRRRTCARKPPVDRAKEVFGYDADLNALYYKDKEGGVLEYDEIGAKFTKLDGHWYATWRLKSCVLLGTVDGFARRKEDAN